MSASPYPALPSLQEVLHTLPMLSRHETVALLATASAIREACLAYLSQTPQPSHGPAVEALLSVREAAALLHVSRDYLYKNKHRYPFYVQVGRRVLCSARGIHDWIAKRQQG